MHIEPDRMFVPAGAPATRFLSVTISAPASSSAAGAGQARPGVDVSLVLDRSGSMAGRKIDLARQAVAHAIRLMTSTDRLSVVVYDDHVDTVLETMPATREARQQALGALAAIDARGSTDLAEGWLTGARSLGATMDGGPGPAMPAARTESGSSAGGVKRVLLLTDGLANRGITEPATLKQAAARLRAQGIGTTTFGLGEGFDEELLTGLATEGGGHFYYIEHPRQIPDLFASELGEVLDVVARDAVFEVTAGPGVQVALLNPMPVARDGPVTRVRLGDFVSEQELTLLIALQVDARQEGETASITCRVSDRDAAMVAVPLEVSWTAVPPAQDAAQPVNLDIIRKVARMMVEAARMAAVDANRGGDLHEAGLAMRRAADAVRALAPDDEIVKGFADRLRLEEDVFARPMASAELKSRRYASYMHAYSREAEGKARRKR